ncbi:geranylgeranyl reductase family protein [Dapis sp. BLCC M172]|uniref:geranylgeranyl reductase family protein n=1 Tax=Dapis sp. BLCC M172 TaxID=2975281 RepID=UPI003CF744DA
MFDCIIVGSGPAGASAAYHLAKYGRSVLVLEKETLPRYKPCGGGVSPIVQEWFDFDFSPAISLKINSIRYTWKKGDLVEVKLQNQQPIWMVRREVFDYFIVQQAQKQGAEIRDKTPVIGIEFKHNNWQVYTNNQSFTSPYLIAADGAKGSMAKWLGFKNRKRFAGGAMEIEVPVKNQQIDSAYFEFGMLNNGYVWNFPKADGYSIGVGTFWRKHGQNFGTLLTEYATMFEVNIQNVQKFGHPLCLWNGNQKLHTQKAVLAGEAACIVDPFTAEGIRPSIFTGIKAATAIHNSLNGDLFALEKYSQIINEEWGKDMVWAQRLAQGFSRFSNIGYQVGVKRPRATTIMTKILSGELRYSDVVSSALRKLWQR